MKEEAVWLAACALGGRSYSPKRHIELCDLEEPLTNLRNIAWISGDKGVTIYLQPLRDKMENLRSRNETEISPAWSPPSLMNESRRPGPLWKFCTDEEIAARVQSVYEGAIDSYVQIVTNWFPTLARRMMHSIMLPVEATIHVCIKKNDPTFRPPLIHCLEEPLACGSHTRVKVIVTGDSLGEEILHQSTYDRVIASYNAMRPEVPPWVPLYFGGWNTTDALFEQDAVTRLTYEWLEKDLKILHIVNS